MRLSVALAVFLCLFRGTLSSNQLDQEWKEWKEKHDKRYSKEEDGRRFDLWKKNREMVLAHNELFQRGDETYEMGMNEFSAMTRDEVKSMLSGDEILDERETEQVRGRIKRSNLPESVDWIKAGYVTSVKNQGQFGTCYAFSVVGAIEGHYKNATGSLVSLSAQQIIDCHQGACGGGGSRVLTFEYLIKTGGLQKETDYPYAGQKQTCKFDPNKVVARVRSYSILPHGDEISLQEAVANIGPISVGIAVYPSLQAYKRGVYFEELCASRREKPVGRHAMLITGYGVDGNKEYWIVKNSWGSGWGENGYIRMGRNRDNNCGIANLAIYPIVSHGVVHGLATSTILISLAATAFLSSFGENFV